MSEENKTPDPSEIRVKTDDRSIYGWGSDTEISKISRVQSVKRFKDDCTNAGGKWLGMGESKWEWFTVACQLNHVKKIVVDSVHVRPDFKDKIKTKDLIGDFEPIANELNRLQKKKKRSRKPENIKKLEGEIAIKEAELRLWFKSSKKTSDVKKKIEDQIGFENYDVAYFEVENYKKEGMFGSSGTGQFMLFGWLDSNGFEMKQDNKKLDKYTKILLDRHPELSDEIKEIDREVIGVKDVGNSVTFKIENSPSVGIHMSNDDSKKESDPKTHTFASTGSLSTWWKGEKRCVVKARALGQKWDRWLFQDYPPDEMYLDKELDKIFKKELAPIGRFNITCFI